MKVYTCRDFTGFYPVGAAAVVWAEDEEGACRKLNLELQGLNLPGDANPANLIEFPHPGEDVRILRDGDY